MKKYLFVDRDGTLIAEPPDAQIDRYEKLALLPEVIPALRRCVSAGYELVMVSNQDGLGTTRFPQADFAGPQQLLLSILTSQGIDFREVLIDPSRPEDGSPDRKPATGLVRHYLAADDWSRADSAVIGDRDTDMRFAANLGVRGLRVGAGGKDWATLAHRLCNRPRQATVQRRTHETRIEASVDLDAPSAARVNTGLGYFDHMLEQLGRHGGFALALDCAGDLDVDDHHTVEDCALVLGEALREALGDKRGIARYGFTLPMDESLATAALDLSGRATFRFEGAFSRERLGGLATEMVPHFFRSFADNLKVGLHLSVKGENAHHMVEACFKAVGRCLREAARREGNALPSTKGML